MSRALWLIFRDASSSLSDTISSLRDFKFLRRGELSRQWRAAAAAEKGMLLNIFSRLKLRKPHVSNLLRHNLLSLRQSKFLWRGEFPKRRIAATAAEEGALLHIRFKIHQPHVFLLLRLLLHAYSMCPATAYSWEGHTGTEGITYCRLDAV